MTSPFYNTTSNFSSFTYEYAEYFVEEDPIEGTIINVDYIEQELEYAVDYIAQMFGGMS